MKQEDAVQAYLAAQKLNKQNTTLKTAKNVFKLVSALQAAWDFQAQEEQKVFARHPKANPKINGIPFKTDEEKEAAIAEIQEINKELDEINETEFDIIFPKFKISQDEQSKLELTGEEYGALQEFIDFEEEDEETTIIT